MAEPSRRALTRTPSIGPSASELSLPARVASSAPAEEQDKRKRQTAAARKTRFMGLLRANGRRVRQCRAWRRDASTTGRAAHGCVKAVHRVSGGGYLERHELDEAEVGFLGQQV